MRSLCLCDLLGPYGGRKLSPQPPFPVRHSFMRHVLRSHKLWQKQQKDAPSSKLASCALHFCASTCCRGYTFLDIACANHGCKKHAAKSGRLSDDPFGQAGTDNLRTFSHGSSQKLGTLSMWTQRYLARPFQNFTPHCRRRSNPSPCELQSTLWIVGPHYWWTSDS